MNDSAGTAPGAIEFPHLAARDLEGRARDLPDDFSGTSNLVIVAFRREQQAMVDSWVAWFETIAAEHPTLRCYEVPVVATAPVRTDTLSTAPGAGRRGPVAGLGDAGSGRERTSEGNADGDT